MDRLRRASLVTATALAAVALFATVALAHPGATARVSVTSDGTQADSSSAAPSVSGDGRYVTFWSTAANLVPGDTNGQSDVFVHDRETGTTSRVSVTSEGAQADLGGLRPSISVDGRYVAFHSMATNLVPSDTNGQNDVFVHDRETGTTSRVSVASDGTQADGDSFDARVSEHGGVVAFFSDATNLVADDTNGTIDVFVHELATGDTTRASIASDGTQGNDISAFATISDDGRYVAFNSDASNLVPDDTNEAGDVFVRDLQDQETTRASVSTGGGQASHHSGFSTPSISGDGRYVAFHSFAPDLVPGDTNGEHDVFVHDRDTVTTTRVSVSSGGGQANDESYYPSISADGRIVAFHSLATNLVAGDTNETYDVFVHDRETGRTRRASLSGSGAEANNMSSEADVSADGKWVAFASQATNLVPDDTNNTWDVFVHDLHGLHFVNDTPLTDIEGTYFEHEIVWIHHEAITLGCNEAGTLYCPTETVTREQMASFLVRALDLPPTDADYFADDEDSVHEGDINALYEADITTGCGTDEVEGSPEPNLLYCPDLDVTREQMASFLARGWDLAPPPATEPNGGDYFTDDEASIHEPDINEVRYAGIALGCGATTYCPLEPVTREQMAAFLQRALTR